MSNLPDRTEQQKAVAAEAVARAKQQTAARKKERAELVVELQAIEERFGDLLPRMNEVGIHGAMLRWAELGEEEGIDEPAWCVMTTAGGYIIRGHTDAINRAVLSLEDEIDRLENPEDDDEDEDD